MYSNRFLALIVSVLSLIGCGHDGGTSNSTSSGSGNGGSGTGGTSVVIHVGGIPIDVTADSSGSSMNNTGGTGGIITTSGTDSTGGSPTSSSDAGAGGTGGASTTSSLTVIDTGTTTSAPEPGGIFQAQNPWNTPVDGDPASPDSDKIITWLADNGGWGFGKMKIDFGITVLQADNSTPMQPFTTTSDFYSPDCDHVPFPVPPNGALEGENGYECTHDGDCHLLVIHKGQNKLYEMWRADITGGVFYGGCTAVWDLTKTYPVNLRGDDCSSADGGGFPIAAMLFTADEVKAGLIDHAIRFILPNYRIRKNVYAYPGTHSSNQTTGGADAPPYGVRFRLRKDFPLQNLPSDGARVIAKAMQKYGMFLADGGNIALTGANDAYTNAKWSDVNVDPLSMASLQVKDFEVVAMGTLKNWQGNCQRNP